MVDQTALLVSKDEIQALITKVTENETEIVKDLETILPFVKNEKMKASFQKRLARGKEGLRALSEGFVPVDPGFFTRTDTRDKWNKRDVKAVLDSMPPEVKEVWEKAEKKGIFKSFSVTTGGGDPILVGNAGGRHFFIAGWLNISQGVTLFGVRMKL